MNGGRRRTLRELGDLGGRGALVAGGAGHVGRAVVETLTEMGARVVVCDLDADAHGIACDLADEVAARAAVREAVSRLGGLDVLVHCAALIGTSELDGWAVRFPEQSAAAW